MKNDKILQNAKQNVSRKIDYSHWTSKWLYYLFTSNVYLL